jgi:hypothetical protein
MRHLDGMSPGNKNPTGYSGFFSDNTVYEENNEKT